MEFTADHVHLRSLDPEKAAAFYVTMFGAKPRPPVPTPAGLRCVVELGTLTLFIEQVPPGTPTPPDPPFVGIEHIAVAVRGMDEAVAELKQKGAAFTTEPHSAKPGLCIAFLRGPDGVRIELLDRSYGR